MQIKPSLLLSMSVFLLLAFSSGCASTFSYDSYLPENNAYISNKTGKNVRLIFEYEGQPEAGTITVAEVQLRKDAERVFTIGGVANDGSALRSSDVKAIYVVNQEGSTLYDATGNSMSVFPATISITRGQLDDYISKRPPSSAADIKELLRNNPAAREGEARYLAARPGAIVVMTKADYKEQNR